MAVSATLAHWLTKLQALLPPGLALTREPGAVLTKLLEALAAVLLAAQLRINALHAQWDPRVATEMLPDWERLLGLPDKCALSDQTLAQRQQTAFGRLTELGGQSRVYFVDLAARYGEPGCAVTEHVMATCESDCNAALHSLADIFYWTLNVPRAITGLVVAHCNDSCDVALQSADVIALGCIANERKPAHTQMAITYTS